MTQGITTTQFGYTGDGDRLWEATAGVTTTFTLDLNTALTQVLAQHSGTNTTRFLPGIGQEVNGAWQYLHTDALGNVRQVTDASGTVLGSRRYSPFGEVVAGSGSLSPLGFTGEHQDAASGLTYLRARYYNAALGRFLTPDSIVPDAANGQAWNSYVYVYNDVVNRVDPSGFAPGPPNPCSYGLVRGCNAAPVSVSDLLGTIVNNVTSAVSRWWNKPNCACSTNNPRDTFVGGIMGALFAGIGTTPFEPTARLTIKTRTRPLGDVLGLFASEWKDVYQESGTYAEMASLRPRGVIGRVFGRETFSNRVGWLTVANTQKQFSNNGLRGLQRVKGGSGLIGGLALSGLIDAMLKLQADSSRCLSGKDRLYNAAIAGLFGIAAAGVGVLAFAGFSALVPAAPIVAVGAGIVAGYIAGNVDHIGSISNPIVTTRERWLR